MKYCKKCVMPDTRPGLYLDEEDICQACRAAERKKEIDWDARMEELRKLCDKYRGRNGDYYDCIVTVSGGKDSYFQTYMMKEVMKMNPLLVNVANFSWTEVGRHNFDNMCEVFGCDIISLHLNRRVGKAMTRKAFEKLGSPNWYWDRAIYVFPLRMGIDMKIPLIVYGENVNYEYGGSQTEETYSAKDQINNDVVINVDWDYWLDKDITMKDFNPQINPTREKIEEAGLEPIYLSYFVPWDGYRNYEFAKKYGFRSLEGVWKREGYIEDYIQIDTIGYNIHAWLKYYKFGHAHVTDVCSYEIRHGRMTRDEAIKLVKEHDHKVDPIALKDFFEFTGYTEMEFWEIAERFRNKDIWEKVDGEWMLKTPLV